MMRRRWLLMGLIAFTGLRLGGCEAASLLGGMAQNFEYSKQIEVLSKYEGLENQTVAVLVQCDMATMYENPDLELMIAMGVAGRIQNQVPGVEVVDPRRVHTWKYRKDNGSYDQIRTGLLGPFVQRTAWLFHTHLEPKYPDKYKPLPK